MPQKIIKLTIACPEPFSGVNADIIIKSLSRTSGSKLSEAKARLTARLDEPFGQGRAVVRYLIT